MFPISCCFGQVVLDSNQCKLGGLLSVVLSSVLVVVVVYRVLCCLML